MKEYQCNNKNSTQEVDIRRIEYRVKPYFIKKRLIDITSHMIQQYYNELQKGDKPLSPSTIKKIHHILNKAF